MYADAEYYRILDADYAIVGTQAGLGLEGRKAINTLRNAGIRGGAVILKDFGPIPGRLIQMLAQIKAVGVVDHDGRGREFADALASQFENAGPDAEWPASPFLPRVYVALRIHREMKVEECHLAGLVRAMLEYAPGPIIFTPDEVIAGGSLSAAAGFARDLACLATAGGSYTAEHGGFVRKIRAEGAKPAP